jgi:pimeloyl-ACP methyl ester carboxylesterase
MGRIPTAAYKTLVKAGYAPVNGLEMYFEIHGSGEGIPVVTIHPFLGLANVFSELATKRPLVAVELQGHGRTLDIDRPLTFEQEADDVAALVAHLGFDQVDLFGESFGGIVAVLLAIRHPGLVRRVATYGSLLGNPKHYRRPEAVVAFAQLTSEHDSVQYQRESYTRVAPNPNNWLALFSKATQIPWNGLAPDELRKIEVPTLIAAGDHDYLGPRLEHYLDVFACLPRGELAIIPDAGHFVLNDSPGRLLSVISEFFDRPSSVVPFCDNRHGLSSRQNALVVKRSDSNEFLYSENSACSHPSDDGYH